MAPSRAVARQGLGELPLVKQGEPLLEELLDGLPPARGRGQRFPRRGIAIDEIVPALPVFQSMSR